MKGNLIVVLLAMIRASVDSSDCNLKRANDFQVAEHLKRKKGIDEI